MANIAGAGRLYARLRETPFLDIGKRVGDFVLYDATIAGYASRLANGETLDNDAARITPDEETLQLVAGLRTKEQRTKEEQAFLDYFALLEDIRQVIVAAARRA